mmetsp:Transcript_24590/g.44709  ORF Transcript_24590/g.44709 Transcript_24590/m.44709 type:complete len:335 (+) Transcript_24590:61-1065(+)
MRVLATVVVCFVFEGVAGGTDWHQSLHKARSNSLRKDEGKLQQERPSVQSGRSLTALATLMLTLRQPSTCWEVAGHNCFRVSRPGCKRLGSRSVVLMNCELPLSPDQMISNAAASVKRARDAGKKRLFLDVVIPQVKNVLLEGESIWDDENAIDPWPGGAKQQYPYAVNITKQIMGIVLSSEDMQDQVLDPEDVCGLVIAQGKTAADDIAVVILPSNDQLKNIQRVDAMCADKRLMVIFNPVFRKIEDFSGSDRGRAKELIYDRGFEVGYSYTNFQCYNRDCQLVGERGPSGLEWQAYVRNEAKNEIIPLSEQNFQERPSYSDLEKLIAESLRK